MESGLFKQSFEMYMNFVYIMWRVKKRWITALIYIYRALALCWMPSSVKLSFQRIATFFVPSRGQNSLLKRTLLFFKSLRPVFDQRLIFQHEFGNKLIKKSVPFPGSWRVANEKYDLCHYKWENLHNRWMTKYFVEMLKAF